MLYMCYSVVNSVAADDVAPEGARPSAGTVITRFRSHLYFHMGPKLGAFDM